MTLPPEEVEAIVLSVGLRLREAGRRVSTGELVKAVELAEAYRALTGSLSRSDLALVIASAFSASRVPASLIEELIAKEASGRGVRERAERIMREIRAAVDAMGARPGDRVSRKKLAAGEEGRDRRLALAGYAKLRSIGAIRGTPGSERILPQHELDRLAWRIAREGYESLEEASRAKLGGGWDDVLTAVEAGVRPGEEKLGEMSERALLDLAEAARRKHDKATRELIAREFLRRISSGRRVSRGDDVADLLEEAGMLTPNVRRRLARESRLDPDKLSPGDVVEILGALDAEEGGSLLARKLEDLPVEEAARMLGAVNPRLLWGLSRRTLERLGDPLLEAAALAARSLREAVLYAQTLEEGRADMSRHYAERALGKMREAGERPRSGLIDESSILAMVQESDAIVSLASSLNQPGDPRLIEGALRGLDHPGKLRLLREVYLKGSPEWRKLILSAAERLLSRLSAREGLRLLREKYASTSPPGRIDVRRSIYGSIRQSPNPITYVKWRKSARVSLSLDASGSMMDYSTWALAVASLFPRHLERLVVFSHYTRVYEGPFTRREFARALLEADFKGYTNISQALRDASVPGVKRIVVITDLRQTVQDEPVQVVVQRLVRSGKRVVFIVPRGHEEEAGRLIEESGGRVIQAGTPRHAAQHLLRILLRA